MLIVWLLWWLPLPFLGFGRALPRDRSGLIDSTISEQRATSSRAIATNATFAEPRLSHAHRKSDSNGRTTSIKPENKPGVDSSPTSSSASTVTEKPTLPAISTKKDGIRGGSLLTSTSKDKVDSDSTITSLPSATTTKKDGIGVFPPPGGLPGGGGAEGLPGGGGGGGGGGSNNQDPQRQSVKKETNRGSATTSSAKSKVTTESSFTASSTSSDACARIPLPSSLPPAIQSPIPTAKAGDKIIGQALPLNSRKPENPAAFTLSSFGPNISLAPLGPGPVILPDPDSTAKPSQPDDSTSMSLPPLGPGPVVLPDSDDTAKPTAKPSQPEESDTHREVIPFGGPVKPRHILETLARSELAARAGTESDYDFDNDEGDNPDDSAQSDFFIDGTVDLRADGYQEIAATNKVLLVSENGELSDVTQLYITKKPNWLKGAWAGDHIYELGLFVKFLDLKPEYARVKDAIKKCGILQRQIIGMLNGPGNLVGVDRGVNNLKMVYLQSNGPTASNTIPPLIYKATKNYFIAFQKAYQKTYIQIAHWLGNIANDAKIGDEFEKYSQDRYDKAFAKLRAYKAPAGDGLGEGKWEYSVFKIPQ